MFVNVCVSWAFSFKKFLYSAVFSKEIKKECGVEGGWKIWEELGEGKSYSEHMKKYFQ